MEFIKEIWKPVVEYEGIYEVSNLGRVKSCERTIVRSNGSKMSIPEKIMKPTINHSGYETVLLSNRGSQRRRVHRLVGQAFIENPYSKEQINHKNGIKTDNSVQNLEWVTNQENKRHASKNGLTNRKKVCQLTLDGQLIRTFESIADATLSTGVNNITTVCKGRQNQAGGFKWCYYTEHENHLEDKLKTTEVSNHK